MFPGILALAILQSLILYLLTGTILRFFLHTLLGAVFGVFAGFVWPFVLPVFAFPPPLIETFPFEASWAFLTGATIGAFQVGEIARCFVSAVERRET